MRGASANRRTCYKCGAPDTELHFVNTPDGWACSEHVRPRPPLEVENAALKARVAELEARLWQALGHGDGA